jgi:hypothetical protein
MMSERRSFYLPPNHVKYVKDFSTFGTGAVWHAPRMVRYRYLDLSLRDVFGFLLMYTGEGTIWFRCFERFSKPSLLYFVIIFFSSEDSRKPSESFLPRLAF